MTTNKVSNLFTMDKFSIVGRERHGFIRTVKESIYLRVYYPILNRNIRKYILPFIWDGALVKTPEFQIKHK